MKYIFILIAMSLFVQNSPALNHAFNGDSIASKNSNNNYQIICKPYSKYKYEKKLDNGYNIAVWDTFDVKRSGTLRILNSETILLEHKNGRTDTISIGAINHIQNKPLGRRMIANGLMGIGGVGLITSFGLLGAAAADTGSSSSIYGGVGFLAFIVFMPIEIIGIAINSGGHFRSEKYQFKIVPVGS